MDGEADILADMLRPRGAEPLPPAPVTPQPRRGAAITAILLGALVGGVSISGGLWVAERLVQGSETSGNGLVWAEAAYTLTVFLPILIGGLAGGFAMRSPGMGLGNRAGRRLARGLLLGAGGLLIATLYSSLAGSVQPMPVQRIGAGALLVGTLLILLQAGSEEVLLRGWLQPVIATRLPAWTAVLISALLFAALHLLGGARAPMALLNLFLGGLLFGLLALRTGGLAAPIAAHFAWNWTEAILLGLSPNPGVGGYGAIWNLDLAGPATWGGTDEGLNVSIGTAAVLIALLLLTLKPRGSLA
jgi:uncharacterized protein